MKINVVMSLVAVGLLTSANGADDLSSMFQEGKVSGQIREFSISRAYIYDNPATKDFTRTANAIGGNLKFETAEYSGWSFGTAFYTTNGFGLGGNKATNTKVDPTLLGVNNEGYSLLGEAYLQYKNANTTFKGGRQKLDTPLAGSDDARMVPNLFEAYLLINTDIPYTTLIAGHVIKFAQGTFGRVYNAAADKPNAILSVTSGYSLTDSRNQVGDFVNMGEYAIGKSTDGVSVASATFAPNKNIKVQAWDYYAHNILNAFYGQADASWNCLLTDKIHPSLSAQVIKENEVGNKLAGQTQGFYWGAKFGAGIGNFNALVAYSQAAANSAAQGAAGGSANAIITPWGGMPAYTQGMVTRHQFIAGTKATKAAVSYDFKDLGANVIASAYYTSFDMDKNSGYGVARIATEPGFDLAYKPAVVKNLELKFRGNFPRKFTEATDGNANGWDEYRFIANYNF